MTDAEIIETIAEHLHFVRAWAQMKMIRAEIQELSQQRSARRERKTFHLAIKAIDEEGVFEGLAAAYHVRDLGGDVVDPGAFADAFSSGTTHLPLLFNHDIHTVIGVVEISDSAAGLKVRGRLNLSVARAREIYSLVKQGAVRGLSIGYQTLRSVYRGATRHLQSVRLFEVSVVPTGLAMQRFATIDTVKSQDRDVEQLSYLLRDIRQWAAAHAVRS